MIVVKVGGSLYDLPDLGSRLQEWIADRNREAILIVPGGGPLVEQIRALDQTHGLGEELCHDLALRALSINALLLTRLIFGSITVSYPWERINRVMVLDTWSYFQSRHKESDVPHTWDATSDSLAAQIAKNHNARELVLMKSVEVDPSATWDEAARHGWVDRHFPNIAATLDIPIRVINLRAGIGS